MLSWKFLPDDLAYARERMEPNASLSLDALREDIATEGARLGVYKVDPKFAPSPNQKTLKLSDQDREFSSTTSASGNFCCPAPERLKQSSEICFGPNLKDAGAKLRNVASVRKMETDNFLDDGERSMGYERDSLARIVTVIQEQSA